MTDQATQKQPSLKGKYQVFPTFGTEEENYKLACERWECYLILKGIVHEFDGLPDDTRVIMTKDGEYSYGEEAFEAYDRFKEKYPHKDPKHIFELGKVR